MLQHPFPDDPIVGEEPQSCKLTLEQRREGMVDLANETLTGELELGDNRGWGIGSGQESYLGTSRWTNSHVNVDYRPLDGAKGFLRGEQYAVCLALVIDEQVKVGVIGCPLILANPEKPECIFVAGTGYRCRTDQFFLIVISPVFSLVALLHLGHT